MSDSSLEKIANFVASNAQNSQGLLLYALVSTLTVEQSGYLFKLVKLREMQPETRQLAYELLELMARGENKGPEWDGALERIDNAVRGN